MIAQLCNSHGFFHGWSPTPYHHQIFREITAQVEEIYDGRCIIVDDTWISNIANEEAFVAMYPNVMRQDIEHIFFVNLLDPSSKDMDRDYQEIITQLVVAKNTHIIPTKSQFSFWGHFCQTEFARYKGTNGNPSPWIGDKLFLSYNRKPTSHRVTLVRTLTESGLVCDNVVTLGNPDPAKAVVIRKNKKILDRDTAAEDFGIPNDIASVGDSGIWKQCFINVVTETVTNGNFLSEKVWKPIIGKRPFMLVGPPRTLEKLRSWGFKTFDSYWPETYNNLVHELKPWMLHEEASCQSITRNLLELNALTLKELKDMYDDMKPILEHNHNHFFGEFARMNEARIKTIVQDEME